MSFRKPSESVESVDVDVTPIMNLFVILIPFLVSMAVFTHYSTLQFNLPPVAGVSTGGPKLKDLKLTVIVRDSELELTQGEISLSKVQLHGGAWGNEFKSQLNNAREKIKNTEAVVVAVDDEVEFEKVVLIMDYCRELGFFKVSIAEGIASQEGKNEVI